MSAARAAYEAYCNYTGGRSLVTGDLLPTWINLKPEIKNAWLCAARAAWKAIEEALPDPPSKDW